MTSDNQVESLSIDETNALRIKLGLKPLYNDPTTTNETNNNTDSNSITKYSADTEITYVKPVLESKKSLDIERRLNDRLNRKARSELIKGPSLAQSLNDDPLDPLIWAQRQRNKQKLIAKQNAVTYSDDEDIPDDSHMSLDNHQDLDPQAQLKLVHDYKTLDTNSVLTLCDTGILEAQDEGVDDIDYLQSTDLVEKERIDKNNAIKRDKPTSYEDYISKAMDDSGDRNILEKYDEVIKENEGSRFTRFFKGFFLGKKTSHKIDNPDAEIVIGKSSNGINSDNGKIIKKSIPKISKRAKVPDWDTVFESNTQQATSQATSQNNTSTPKVIIKPRRIDEIPTDDIDNMLYKQLTKQRRIIRSEQSNTSVKLENIKQDHYEVKYEISQLDEFCKYVEPTNTQSRSQNKPQSNGDAPPDLNTDSSNPLQEQPLDCGIANTLKYLKTKGQLEPVVDDGDIKLNYINKYGKTMTPKEAFKELCYSFHGKMPGKNKQEKRLRKIEMELRLLQNPTDSLPTMKALRQNQKSDKCAHMILDGSNK